MIKGALKQHLKKTHKEDASEEVLMACQIIPPGQGNEEQRDSSETQTEPPLPSDPILHVTDMAAIEALHRKFPHGWEVLPTSAVGFYCIFYAFIGSIEAQYPSVPLANVQRDLVPMLDAPELAYARDALEGCRKFAITQNPSSREAQETNRGHLLFDHGMAAVYHWYRKHHGIHIAAGLIRRSHGYRDRTPQFYDTDTTSETSLSVWIECDMALDNVVEKLVPELPAGEVPMNHFSSLRAKPAPAPPAPLPTGDSTPGPNQNSKDEAPMTPKKKKNLHG